jgi:hypothetical protein
MNAACQPQPEPTELLLVPTPASPDERFVAPFSRGRSIRRRSACARLS